MISIIFSYLICSLSLKSNIFEEFDWFTFVVYFLLFIVTTINAYLVNKFDLTTLYVWILLSIIPGIAFILYSRFHEGTGGWVSFPWDWGLWELFIPIIFGFFQIIFLLACISSRRKISK